MPNDAGRCPISEGLHDHAQSTPSGFDDFRNLFGPASSDEQYQGFGAGHEDKTQEMLLHLEACMANSGAEDGDGESGIPAGYTYLAQLAAHDLVQNSAPLPQHRTACPLRGNLRRQRLMLETIYGGGPGAIPYAYSFEGGLMSGKHERNRLRLHIIEEDEADIGDSDTKFGRLRDLPRIAPINHSGKEVSPDRLVDVLVADPRNDDHLILAQLTVIFHILHNWIVDRLVELDEQDGISETRADYFVRARKATTFLFRRVVFADLLRQLLHPKVHEFYEDKGGRLDYGDERMPLEFSHAVFRAGHTMVRNVYRLNRDDKAIQTTLNVLFDRTSSQTATQVPHSKTWWVQWSSLFQIPARQGTSSMTDNHVDSPFVTPQMSNPLSPAAVPNLVYEDAFLVGRQGPGGLLYHDFLRGAFSGLRSVASLVSHVLKLLPEEYACVGALMDEESRRRHLSVWLNNNRRGYKGLDLEAHEVQKLIQDPPLLFFILVEAMVDNADKPKKGFGFLGSIIVAEVLYAARDKTFALIEGDPAVCDDVAHVFPNGVPETMPDLILDLAEATGLAHLDCRFV